MTILPLKGNSHQILLSETRLPGIEVLIEKLLPKTIREIGEGEPLKKTMQSCLCTAQVRCDAGCFGTISTTSQAKISVCMQGSRESCLVCARIPELFV